MPKDTDDTDFDDSRSYASAAAWEDETYRKLKRSRNLAWVVASIAGAIAALCAVGLVLFALKPDDGPYIVTVDRTTGHAERNAIISETAKIPNDEALALSYAVKYVINRETYDPADNDIRIFDVRDLSTGLARQSFEWDWDYDNPEHLETVYGKGQVVVAATSADLLSDNTATVRFTKTYRAEGKKPATEPFVAIVGFQFVNRPKTIGDVWENPLGFEVTEYRAQRENIGR